MLASAAQRLSAGPDNAFVRAVRDGIARTASVAGRTARAEFWYFAIVAAAAWIVLFPLLAGMFEDPVAAAVAMAILSAPFVTAAIRRLHDINRSGYWFLIGVIPVPPVAVIGAIVLIYWWARPGDPGANRFGPPAADAGSAMKT